MIENTTQQARLNVDTYVQTIGSARFTVDLAQEKVILIIKPEDESTFANPRDGLMRIGDNFILLSMGVSLPFGFELDKIVDDDNIYQNVSIYCYTNNDTSLDKIILFNSFIPFANYELSINMFIRVPYDIQLYGRFNPYPSGDIYISMAGVPEIFDGKTFNVPIFLKVQHKGVY